MPESLTAEKFIEAMNRHQSNDELEKIQRYFKTGKGEYGEGDVFMGIRMGTLFELAKEYVAMPTEEILLLLQHPIHEVRAGALSIMDKQARSAKTSEVARKDLYDLYLENHDRINNWDLVDLAAPYVIGGYLRDKPKDILYTLSRSSNLWERRTAMVATYYFIRQKEVDETFAIAEILLSDDEDLIHKAVGGGLRWAGDKNPAKLQTFLDLHAPTMPRTMLRYAIEKLPPDLRAHYLGLKV